MQLSPDTPCVSVVKQRHTVCAMWSEGLVRVEGCKESGPGRYVVAAQNLPAGQVVLTETPLVFGPKQSSSLVCVECCGVMLELRGCER